MSYTSLAGQRGPAEHERREQIVAAANRHFRHYGYEKTTVADLAKAIGLSKAYVYKFFESKQAIGEAVCSGCLGKIAAKLCEIAAEEKPASDRLRRIIKCLAHESAEMFLNDRKIHDLATTSFSERWGSASRHETMLLAMIEKLLREGRDSGEFDRRMPLAESSRAVMLALQPFQHPALLLHNLDTLDGDAMVIATLVLRGLAP
ncbi:TetR/AcrR family transcriptional regulator [Methylocella silvestris]|uniref:TetR family transcriptional regulator n=1 Tax=Methylocella silvestris TaxID=199596 RepID=A0A2J7TJ23_METSI|nr:TetR/AcrR family transcriptional regulator [Methylocella silvestris]PNG26772.1 TetR family transcriptional regulator [Methylocella silvestris]